MGRSRGAELPRRCPWMRLIFLCAYLSSCGSHSSTAPTPVPLALTCPQRIDASANAAGEANVTFDPTSQGGTPPISIECSPAAGTFHLGETPVSCHATDARSQTATCDFVVVVVAPPRLAVTRFDAFGDSITEGVVSVAESLLVQLPAPDAYPTKLETMLNARYTAQTITVLNRGIGGERLATGRARLPGVLDEDHPEVLLLLEGINNIRGVSTDQLATDLDAMVRSARRGGVKIMLATLLPISSSREARNPGTMDRIEAFNEQIVRIANKYRIGPVVDTFTPFAEMPALIGSDGLHPTADGYTRLAEVFFDAIRARFEVEAPEAITASTPTGAPVVSPHDVPPTQSNIATPGINQPRPFTHLGSPGGPTAPETHANVPRRHRGVVQ
jgi:acyl-CoA thioesterase-1